MGEVQGQGYIGQALGYADVLAVAYGHALSYRPDEPEWEGRDRFLLSHGHYAIAYYAARMVTPRVRTLLLLAVVMPLWSNYLVRVFAWRIITSGDGPLQSLLRIVGIRYSISASNWAVWLTFCYLWLPFAILPIYAALERVPGSLLEASSDLGAHSGLTFRRVVVPLVFPGLVAASIFTFSLTLGDYITPVLVGKAFFIGNSIYNLVGLASNLPLAAAFAFVPIAIMAIYLIVARKLGAFEAI
jgi:putative spermidine/putrescine transport system permease protein